MADIQIKLATFWLKSRYIKFRYFKRGIVGLCRPMDCRTTNPQSPACINVQPGTQNVWCGASQLYKRQSRQTVFYGLTLRAGTLTALGPIDMYLMLLERSNQYLSVVRSSKEYFLSTSADINSTQNFKKISNCSRIQDSLTRRIFTYPCNSHLVVEKIQLIFLFISLK